jgi:hypothetical protein
MNKYIKNLKYIFRHKWYVFLECRRIGITWRGIMHDMSKLLPDEFGPYAEYFYGDKPNHYRGFHNGGDDQEFDKAWLKHIHRNPHHHQYYVLRKDDGTSIALEMPDVFVKEMCADWCGAGRAQNKPYNENDPYKETRGWYLENRDKMTLHPKTKEEVEFILEVN